MMTTFENELQTQKGPTLRTDMTSMLLMGVPLLDELASGFPIVALPLVRDDLGLSYDQAGFLLTCGGIVSLLAEPPMFALSDRGSKRPWILGGMALLGLAWMLAGSAPGYLWLLAAFALLWPMNGAAVGISQAMLIDMNPGGSSRVMTRWTLMGGIGDLLAPPLIALLVAVGLGWRPMFWLAGILWLGYALILQRHRMARPHVTQADDSDEAEEISLWAALKQIIKAPGLWRWAILLELGDLLDEVLVAFAALYLSDVVGLSPVMVSVMLSGLMVGAVVGLVILERLLHRIEARRLLPAMALLTLAGLAALLMGRSNWVLLAALFAVGFGGAAFYPIMKAEVYDAVPGRSGTVAALLTVVEPVSVALPWVVGLIASTYGLSAALATIGLAPLAALLFAPRGGRGQRDG